MSDAAILHAALHQKTGAELLDEKATEKQLRFMVRVKRGQSTTLWLAVIDHLLALGDQQLSSGSPAWTIDISKQYFRRPELKYGWRIILQSSNLKAVCEQLASAVETLRPSMQNVMLEEVPLHGNPNRKGGRMTPA